MRATYKYKVYTSKRNQKVEDLFGSACWVYNHCIALHKRYYRLYHKSLGKFQLQKHLTKLKKQPKYLNWSKLSSQTIQQITDKIDEGYKRFLKKQAKRPPTFKSRRRYQSITFKNTGWSLSGNEFVINSIHLRLKFSLSREIGGDIKTVTLKRDAVGDLWLCFSLDNVIGNLIEKPKTGKTAGFDFGLKTFLTCSDETAVHSPRFLFDEIAVLRSTSRNLSKKKKGSNNRRKARKDLALLHRSIQNKRSDFHWKTANHLVTKYDVLYFEDLHIKAMQMLWGRKISDLGFAEFLNIVEYLALKHGKQVVKIDRFYPSSKTCCKCGHIYKDLKLKERSWCCPTCNTIHDRDLNASRNILRVGASTHTGETLSPASVG